MRRCWTGVSLEWIVCSHCWHIHPLEYWLMSVPVSCLVPLWVGIWYSAHTLWKCDSSHQLPWLSEWRSSSWWPRMCKLFWGTSWVPEVSQGQCLLQPTGNSSNRDFYCQTPFPSYKELSTSFFSTFGLNNASLYEPHWVEAFILYSCQYYCRPIWMIRPVILSPKYWLEHNWALHYLQSFWDYSK